MIIEITKYSFFLLIPLVAWITLAGILVYLYFKDRNKRKLVFAIGAFVSAFSFYNPILESFGYTPLFPHSEWLLIPIALAVAVAALSSLFKVKDFKWPFVVFAVGIAFSLVAFFVQLQFAIFNLILVVALTAMSVPVLMYIFVKSRDNSDLYFLIATLCFLFQGLVMELGKSVDIPVMLAIFGVVFICLMFNRPDNVNPSDLTAFIVLEKKLDEANHNLKTLEAKLLKAERLAAIGELAGIIGHDLRNPLQGMMGATHYLKSHASEKDDATCIEMLNEIDDCIRRSDKIINDLIEYSRVLNVEPTVTNPQTLTMQALNELTVPSAVVVVNKTGMKPEMTADSSMLQRAFVAIIKNAFDAMPDGGKLTIKSKRSGGMVAFSFEDTGVGMDEATLDKIATPLFTTKAKGMGFGLAVCSRFVEAHGGKVAVDSKTGRGTTVTVTVPVEYKPVG